MIRQTAGWCAACTLVLAAHAGAFAWIERHDPATPPPPAAIFIELEPAPPAPEPAGPLADMPAPAEVARLLTPPDLLPVPGRELELAEPDLPPLPDPSPLTAPPTLSQPPEAALLLATSERPEPRPARRQPERQPEPDRRQPERQRRQAAPASSPAQPQQAARQPSAPSRTGSGGGQTSARQVANWQAEVQGRVARHMQRTRLRGARGSVSATITLTVAANGTPQGMRLAGSSGNATIDAALSQQAARMPRLPQPPSGRPATLTIPIRVDMR